jgi:transposase
MSCVSARSVWCSSPVVRSRTWPGTWACIARRCGCGFARPRLTPARVATALTTEERERLRALERENRELRKANEILKAASTFFAKELDGTPRR